MEFIKRLGKAIIGGLTAAGVPEIIGAVSDATFVWGWQYALYTFFGVGVAVWVRPTQALSKRQQRDVINSIGVTANEPTESKPETGNESEAGSAASE